MNRSIRKSLPFIAISLLSSGLSEGGCTSTSVSGTDEKSATESASPKVEMKVICPYAESICPMIYEPVSCTLRAGGQARSVHSAGNACEGRNALSQSWCERKDADDYGQVTVECLPASN